MSVILLQAQALQRSLSGLGNIEFSRFGFSLSGALQTVRRFHDRIEYWLYRNDFLGRKTEKNFSVLHNHQYTFPGVTFLTFGSSGFNPIIR